MEVVLFKDWPAAPEGHTTHHYKAGDTLQGRVADMAMAAGVAFDPREETKVEPPLEAKTKRGRRK